MIWAYWQQLLACNASVAIGHAHKFVCMCHMCACSERAESLPVWYYTKYKGQKYGKGCMTFWPFFGGARTKRCVVVKDAPQLWQFVDESDHVEIEWSEFEGAGYALRLCWLWCHRTRHASYLECTASLRPSTTSIFWMLPCGKDAATTSWACHADSTYY